MSGEGSLQPVRWRGLPRGTTLLRAVVVAALLGLAAAVLQIPAGCPPGTAPAATGAGGTGPGGSTPGGTGPGGGPGGTDAGRSGPAGLGPGGRTQGGADSTAAAGGQQASALPLPSGSVGVPVRLAEPAALAVLRPGARVDLLVVPAGAAGGEARLLAPRALVLDVVGAGAVDGSSALYLALRPEQAEQAVGVPEGSRFAVVVRG